jgi:type II secretory pathway pseudopilin PulG
MNITKQKRAFTLIEFLLSLVFLSIITALLVPLMTTARERATQKSTLLDMQKWAEAMSSYIADNSKAPTNPQGRLDYKKAILDELSPYLSPIGIVDWWGYPYRIWTGKGITRYGITTGNKKEFIIASFGRKGYMEGWRYDPKNPEQGLFFVNRLEDYEKDLVIWNNRFIRFPKNFIFTYQSNNGKD